MLIIRLAVEDEKAIARSGLGQCFIHPVDQGNSSQITSLDFPIHPINLRDLQLETPPQNNLLRYPFYMAVGYMGTIETGVCLGLPE